MYDYEHFKYYELQAKRFCKMIRTPVDGMDFVSIKKQIERDEETAKGLQDGNQSDPGQKAKINKTHGKPIRISINRQE